MTPLVRTIATAAGACTGTFKLPVFAGDTIKLPSAACRRDDPPRPRQNGARWSGTAAILNQDGKTVQEGELATLVEAKPIAKTDARSTAE